MYETLSVLDKEVGRGGVLGALGGPYNPDVYVLTTKDGLKYRYSQTSGLRTITDTNGHVVTFSRDGVMHSSGISISFERDYRGRITKITDPSGKSLVYSCDALGNLNSVTDRGGATTTFTYRSQPAHYLDSYVDSLGRAASKTEYDDAGRVVAIIGPDGHRIAMTYDIEGRQEIISNARAIPTVYTYDEFGNTTSKNNALGETTSYYYDGNNNLLSETNAKGETITYTYDSYGNVTTRTDNLGDRTIYSYDPAGRLTRITDPKGQVHSYTYDPRGNLVRDIDPTGQSQTFTYDASGNRIGVTDRMGNLTQYTYDASGNVITEIDPLGNRTEYTYDANGQQLTSTKRRTDSSGVVHTLTTSYHYDPSGRIIEIDDPEGNATTFTWDSTGQLQSETDKRGVNADYQYDVRGNLIRVDYSDGSYESYSYDENNNKLTQRDRDGNVQQTSYDVLDRALETINPLGHDIRYEYDLGGYVSAIVEDGVRTEMQYDGGSVFSLQPQPDPNSQPRSRLSKVVTDSGYTVTLQNDANGNLVQATDSDGKSVKTTFNALNVAMGFETDSGSVGSVGMDPNGDPQQIVDPFGVQYTYERNALGRVTGVADALGHGTSYAYDEVGNKLAQTDANGHVTRWDYDDAGHVIRHTLPDGSFETFVYNQVGDLTEHTSFAGLVTTYAYDSRGRLTTKTAPDGTFTRFVYRNDGRVDSETDPTGTTRYTYDLYGRITRLEHSSGWFVAYTYDASGNRRSVTTASGTTSYEYDRLNRLISVTDPDGEITTYTYDDATRTRTTHSPNGVTTVYAFDAQGQVVSVTDTDSSGVVFERLETLTDSAAQRRTITELSGRTTSYTYDAMNQLVEELVTDSSGAVMTTTYTYDAVGNRLTRTDSSGTVNYVYDEDNRLLSAGDTTYTYDADGNETSQTDASSTTYYSYTADGLLSQVRTSDGHVVTYGYDARGTRLTEEIDGQLRRFVVDEQAQYTRVLEVLAADGSLLSRRTYGDQLLSQREADGTSVYYSADLRGSPYVLTDSSGKPIDTIDYDAFGRVLSHTGMSTDGIGFLGEEADPTTQLVYLRARYLDPTTGRFITRDPLSGDDLTPITTNLYLYARNNPTVYVDPSGKGPLAEEASLLNLDFIQWATQLGWGLTAVFGAGASGVKLAGIEKVLTHLLSPALTTNIGIGGFGSFGTSSSLEVLIPTPFSPASKYGVLAYSSAGVFFSFSLGKWSLMAFNSILEITGNVSVTEGSVFNTRIPTDYTHNFYEGSVSFGDVVAIDYAVGDGGNPAATTSTGFMIFSIPEAVFSITFAWRWYTELGGLPPAGR